MTVPEPLIQAIRQGRLIPFVGAGISMSVRGSRPIANQYWSKFVAGEVARPGGPPARLFPSWRELLESAAMYLATGDDRKRQQADLIKAHLGPKSDFLAAADAAKEGLGNDWKDFIRYHIDLPVAAVDDESLALARAVWGLGSKLVITTNYDRVMSWALADPRDLKEIVTNDVLVHEVHAGEEFTSPTIWHLHGHIHRYDQLILTSEQYCRLYPGAAGTSEYQRALNTLRGSLERSHYLFIGFSLDDKHFGDQLEWCNSVYGESARTHYVLIRAADVEKARSRVPKNVTIIPYSGHGEPLVALLRELSGTKSPSTETGEKPAPENAHWQEVFVAKGEGPGKDGRLGTLDAPTEFFEGEANLRAVIDDDMVCWIGVVPKRSAPGSVDRKLILVGALKFLKGDAYRLLKEDESVTWAHKYIGSIKAQILSSEDLECDLGRTVRLIRDAWRRGAWKPRAELLEDEPKPLLGILSKGLNLLLKKADEYAYGGLLNALRTADSELSSPKLRYRVRAKRLLLESKSAHVLVGAPYLVELAESSAG